MADYLPLLFRKAFRVIPGADYNRTLEELTSGGKSIERAPFYEVALDDGKPWEYLRDRVYPSFVRYLKNKGIDPENPDQVTVAIFHRDQCYLVGGPQFIEMFQEMEGINPAAFHFRVLRWLAG
jgi:hypothetical protein